MPPDPNVILAWPRRTQPCPTSDACWSPTSAAIGGPPGNAVASPTMPLDSTICGNIVTGMPNVAASPSFQPVGSPPQSPVTAALVWSVTCAVPPVRVQASQLSTVPKQRSLTAVAGDVGEQPGELGDRLVGGDRHPVLGLGGDAVEHRAQVLPSDARPDRLARRPVPDDRAGPLVGDTDGDGCRPPLENRRGGRTTAAAIAAASNSTRPGNGVLGGIAWDSMATT